MQYFAKFDKINSGTTPFPPSPLPYPGSEPPTENSYPRSMIKIINLGLKDNKALLQDTISFITHS